MSEQPPKKRAERIAKDGETPAALKKDGPGPIRAATELGAPFLNIKAEGAGAAIGTWTPRAGTGSPQEIVGTERGPFMASPESNGEQVEHVLVQLKDGTKIAVPEDQVRMHTFQPNEKSSKPQEATEEVLELTNVVPEPVKTPKPRARRKSEAAPDVKKATEEVPLAPVQEAPPLVRKPVGMEGFVNTYVQKNEKAIIGRTEFNPPALKTDSLVEMARTHETDGMLSQLDGYINMWQKYASGHDVFRSSNVDAMRQGRKEALELAEEVARLGTGDHSPAVDQLRAKLEEIGGPLAIKVREEAEGNQERIRMLDLTAKERERALEEIVSSFPAETAQERHERQSNALVERLGLRADRDASKEALNAHYAELKKYLHAEASYKKLGKKANEGQVAEFEAARAKYDAAKAILAEEKLKYVTKLQDSVSDRLSKDRPDVKDEVLEDLIWYRGKGHFTKEQVAKRYNRMVRLREITIPGIKQEQKAREEVLDERGRGLLGTLSKWNKNVTEKLESGATSLIRRIPGLKLNEAQVDRAARITARYARLLTVATIGTGVGIAGSFMFGGAATAAILAMAGGRLGLGAASIGVGAAAGSAWGKKFAESDKAWERKEQFEQAQEKNIESEEDFVEQEQAEQTGSKRAIDAVIRSRENLVAALTGGTIAFVGGGGIDAVKNASNFLWNLAHGHLPGSTGSIQAPTSAPKSAPASPSGAAPIPRPGSTPNAVPTHTPQTPTAKVGVQPKIPGAGIKAPAASMPTESMSIGGKINNADKLFGHFRDALHDHLDKLYPDGKNMPPALKEFYAEPKSQDALTKLLGFQSGKGLSAMMQKGDTVSFEKGSLIFKPLHGDAHTLIDANGKVTPIDLSKMRTTGGVREAVTGAPASSAAPNVNPETIPGKVVADAPVAQPDAPAPSGSAVDTAPAPTPEAAPTAPITAPAPESTPAGAAPSGTPEATPTGAPPSPSAPDGMSGAEAIGSPQTGGTSGLNAAPSPVSSDVPAGSAYTGGNTAAPSTLRATVESIPTGTSSSVPEGMTATEMLGRRPTGGIDAFAATPAAPRFELNPDVPTRYNRLLPGTDIRQPFAFGGTGKASSDMAETYVKAHPNSRMYFITTKPHLFRASTVVVSEWTSDANGAAKLVEKALDAQGKPIPVPDTNEFVGPLPN